MEKLEQFVIEKFPGIIFSFAAFWFALIAYGLFSS
jgi:hypothetical protein